MKTKKTECNAKIAGKHTADHWKVRKEKLTEGRPEDWKQAYDDFFQERINTRYFNPIKLLINDKSDVGEGFSIVTLQCSLIEFLASTLEGKNYKHIPPGSNMKCEEYEYNDSSKLFTKFLHTAIPFKDCFTSKTKAGEFYKDVRCALFHEARTKGGWKIRAGDGSFPPVDVKNKIVYRSSLQSAFQKFVDWYGERLPYCDELQSAFIRKFDSLCRE